MISTEFREQVSSAAFEALHGIGQLPGDFPLADLSALKRIEVFISQLARRLNLRLQISDLGPGLLLQPEGALQIVKKPCLTLCHFLCLPLAAHDGQRSRYA